jgi:hypothetical protein
MRLLFLFLWLPVCLTAQEIQTNEGPEIGEMVKVWVDNNRKSARIDGWRVQILSTTDRQQAELARLKFSNEFPDLYADWIHEKPFYKLRVGACRTRREAMTLLDKIKDFYPGAYPAKDPQIQPKDFLKQRQ